VDVWRCVDRKRVNSTILLLFISCTILDHFKNSALQFVFDLHRFFLTCVDIWRCVHKKRANSTILLLCINCTILSVFALHWSLLERWGAGVETQKYVRGDIGGWGRVPFNETYAPSLSTIYDGA